MLLAVVGAVVVLVSGRAGGAADGGRARFAARAELLAHAASCNTHIAHTHTPTNPTHTPNIIERIWNYKKLDNFLFDEH